MKKNQSLKVLALGGLGEIGMNCLILELDQDIIVIDCGVLFGNLGDFGIDFIIPNFKYLIERKEKIKAFVITHGHEDHIGALPFAIKEGLSAPIYASPFTSGMIRERLTEAGVIDKVQLKVTPFGSSFEVGDFKIKTVPVNHSIVEASALIIDTPLGKIVHTGDFRLDSDPFYGKAMTFNEFKKAGDEGVLLLLSDSTNVEVDRLNDSESIVGTKFEEIFEEASGLVIVSMFSSNISRMGQVFEAAKKLKKKVMISGRSMHQNSKIAMEMGYLKGADKSLIDIEDADQYRRDKLVAIMTGSQGEYRSVLARLSKNEFPHIKAQEGDQVVMSSRFIPGNEKAVSRVINQMFRRGTRVLYEPLHHVHVSGHATKPELLQMLKAVRPQFFIPVHGEYRHLVLHEELARKHSKELGLKQSMVVSNNEHVEITPSKMKKFAEYEDIGTLVDSPNRNITTISVLRSRRKLAEKGVVSVLVICHRDSYKLVCPPKIATQGVMDETLLPWVEEEAIKKITQLFKALESGHELIPKGNSLEDVVKIELRRFFNLNFGKKLTVLAHLQEL